MKTVSTGSTTIIEHYPLLSITLRRTERPRRRRPRQFRPQAPPKIILVSGSRAHLVLMDLRSSTWAGLPPTKVEPPSTALSATCGSTKDGGSSKQMPGDDSSSTDIALASTTGTDTTNDIYVWSVAMRFRKPCTLRSTWSLSTEIIDSIFAQHQRAPVVHEGEVSHAKMQTFVMYEPAHACNHKMRTDKTAASLMQSDSTKRWPAVQEYGDLLRHRRDFMKQLEEENEIRLFYITCAFDVSEFADTSLQHRWSSSGQCVFAKFTPNWIYSPGEQLLQAKLHVCWAYRIRISNVRDRYLNLAKAFNEWQKSEANGALKKKFVAGTPRLDYEQHSSPRSLGHSWLSCHLNNVTPSLLILFKKAIRSWWRMSMRLGD